MAVICNTSGVYALYDTDDAQHEVIATLIKVEPGPLFLPVILLAESAAGSGTNHERSRAALAAPSGWIGYSTSIKLATRRAQHHERTRPSRAHSGGSFGGSDPPVDRLRPIPGR